MFRTSLLLLFVLAAFTLAACASDADPISDGDENPADGDADGDIDGDTDGELDAADGDEPADGDGDGDVEVDGDPEDEAEPQPAPLVDEAGYIDIEPITYSLHANGADKELESSHCKLWYIFQPANEDPDDKPLAVFFNGGPGSSTGLLFGFNTARTTLDPAYTGDADVADSPAQWTELYNVIYIDARQTGFSYCTAADVDKENAREEEFKGRNFNGLFDGADFVRVVLRFLAAHPQLEDNRIVIAGESYGGVRASVILNLALFYTRYGDGSAIYDDPQLAADLQAHYDRVFPDYAGSTVPPQVIATQWSHQVLIQPLLSGKYQDEVAARLWETPGSVMYQVADEEGLTYTPCEAADQECDPYTNALLFLMYEAERDIYNYTQQYGWLFALGDEATRKLLAPEIMAEAIGYDPAEIDALYAANRLDAYRLIGTEPEWLGKSAAGTHTDQALALLPFAERAMWDLRQRYLFSPDLTTGSMPDTFGALQPWDRYYIDSHRLVNAIFHYGDLMFYGVEPYNPIYGEMFLENLLYVNTFITNAAYDLIIYQPGLSEALAMHTESVASVDWEQDPRAGEARGGWMTVNYPAGAFGLSEPTSRSFRFPLYAESCHAVEVTEPVEFLDDVKAWWAATQP